MSSSLLERFSKSDVDVEGHTGANGEGCANQESDSRQAGPSNTEGKGLVSTGLPPLSMNSGRVTEGFGIRSRSWHEEVGLHFPIFSVLVAMPLLLLLLFQKHVL